MQVRLPKIIATTKARTVWALLIVCLLVSVPAYARNNGPPPPDKTTIKAEITAQAGSGTPLEAALLMINAQENAGYSVQTACSYNSGAHPSCDWGPMQVNDRVWGTQSMLDRCAAAQGMSSAALKALITSPNASVADPPAVKCAIVAFNANGAGCSTLCSQLCAYNMGNCRSNPAQTAHDQCPSGYTKFLYDGSGLDCATGGAAVLNPVTGQPLNQPVSGVTGSIACANLDLAAAMQEATAAFSNAAIANTRNIYEMSPRSDIRASQCLGSGFFSFFDVIRALLSGVNLIILAINAIVSSILQAVCNYVANIITSLISSVLSLFCLPTLPGLNFGLPALGGFGRATCNGTSLLNFGGGTSVPAGGGMPPFYENMSRGIPGSGGSFRF